MSADWSKGVEELVQAWQSDPLNARAAFLAYRDYLVGLENVRASAIRCVRAMPPRNGASCSSWWTWWMTNRKAAGCRSASMPT